MNFLHVRMICITDIHDSVNSYNEIFLYVLYTFVCFLLVPRPIVWCQPQGSKECMYVCMYNPEKAKYLLQQKQIELVTANIIASDRKYYYIL